MTPFVGSLLLSYFAAWCGWQAYSRGNHPGGNLGIVGTILCLSLWAIFPTDNPAVARSPYLAHLRGTEFHDCECDYIQAAIKLGEPLKGYDTPARARRDKKTAHWCVVEIHRVKANRTTAITPAINAPVSTPYTNDHLESLPMRPVSTAGRGGLEAKR